MLFWFGCLRLIDVPRMQYGKYMTHIVGWGQEVTASSTIGNTTALMKMQEEDI